MGLVYNFFNVFNWEYQPYVLKNKFSPNRAFKGVIKTLLFFSVFFEFFQDTHSVIIRHVSDGLSFLYNNVFILCFQYAHKQFNSPIGLYSEPNIADTIRRDTNTVPWVLLRTPPKAFDVILGLNQKSSPKGLKLLELPNFRNVCWEILLWNS